MEVVGCFFSLRPVGLLESLSGQNSPFCGFCFHTFPLPLQKEPVSTPKQMFKNFWSFQPSFVTSLQGKDNFIYFLLCNGAGVRSDMIFRFWEVSSETPILILRSREGQTNWSVIRLLGETERKSLKSAGRRRRNEKNLVNLALKFSIYRVFIDMPSIFFFSVLKWKALYAFF